MSTNSITVRNVNEALPAAVLLFNNPERYRVISPRGMTTRELVHPMLTTYLRPTERVLFSPERDANPFFHVFESLWILAGRNDVEWLGHFLPRMADYSDDREYFHGAYGWRMRHPVDQVRSVIHELQKDPDSRRAVIGLWQPGYDSGYAGKDMPCNCTVTFKIREGALQMTVFNRSNDMVWGAYGANAVHFSFLQEYIAAFLRVPVGVYHQFSDSFHVYEDQLAWHAVSNLSVGGIIDPYCSREESDHYLTHARIGVAVLPYPLVDYPITFDNELQSFMLAVAQCNATDRTLQVPRAFANTFFQGVAVPLYNALRSVRLQQYDDALAWCRECHASDWALAAHMWVQRRKTAAASKLPMGQP